MIVNDVAIFPTDNTRPDTDRFPGDGHIEVLILATHNFNQAIFVELKLQKFGEYCQATTIPASSLVGHVWSILCHCGQAADGYHYCDVETFHNSVNV